MKSITPLEVQQKLEAGEKLNIIDVREVAEVESGHIPGIIHMPLNLVPFKHQDLEKNEEYIVVCLAGGRSAQATTFLEEQGYNVTNMTGGMSAWTGEIE